MDILSTNEFEGDVPTITKLDNWVRVNDSTFVHVNPTDNQMYEIRIIYHYDKDPLEWAQADLYCTYPNGECLCLLGDCVVKDILDYVSTFCKQKNDLADVVRKELLEGFEYQWEKN